MAFPYQSAVGKKRVKQDPRSKEIEDENPNWKTQWKRDVNDATLCVKTKEISRTLIPEMRPDKKTWNPKVFAENWPKYMPLIQQVLANIEEMDNEDRKKAAMKAKARGLPLKPGDGLRKHLIFVPCDDKDPIYGPQLVPLAAAASGWNLLRFHKVGSGWELREPSKYGDDTDDKRQTIALMSSFPFSSRIFTTAGRNAPRTAKESEAERRKMNAEVIKLWNSKDNVRGERLRVCAIDQGSATGMNYLSTSVLHFIGKPWSAAQFQQTVGRIARTCGHDKELYDYYDGGYNVEIFVYVGVDENDEPLLDYTLTTKPYDIAASNLMSFLKQSAVDRDLNQILVGSDPNNPTAQESVIEQLGLPM